MAEKQKTVPIKPLRLTKEDKIPLCKNCRMYEKNKANDCGYCHLMPPIMVPEGDLYDWSYPVVNNDDWCSQFLRATN